MNNGIFFSIMSLIYIFLIAIMYFSKDRIKNAENKIYSILLIITIVNLAIEIISTIININLVGFDVLKMISLKLITVGFITWIFTFFVYVYSILFHKDKISYSIFASSYIVIALITFLLPLYANIENGYISYTYGPSVNFSYFISGFLVIMCIGLMMINFKQLKNKKYIPLFSFMIIGSFIAILQYFIPNLLLMSSMEALVTAIMYFTIENPDMRMMKELYKNKRLIEQMNEDTSRFLFRVTQDIKEPVKEIINNSENIKTNNDIENIKKINMIINNDATRVDYLINNALNISNMDTQKIKIYDTKYNVKKMFAEISLKEKSLINNGIRFDYTIGTSLPTYLYGDSIKLKQIINSILNKSNIYTEKGFISLEVNCIVKYDICRLIITIEDSGKGISIDRVNNILSKTNDDIDKSLIENTENMKLDIMAVKKIINIIGGSLMIKSEENKGTTITISIDQKIVSTEETEIAKKLDLYEQNLYGNKKVLVVDNDEKELTEIKKQLELSGAIVHTSIYEKECIEKIRAKLKYDLIILDDEMNNYSALDILKEIKETNEAPVIVMLKQNKENYKLSYLKEGFADYILKSKLKSELERISKLRLNKK